MRYFQVWAIIIHCVVLAILAAIPTRVFGYFDWQHFYGGVLIFQFI